MRGRKLENAGVKLLTLRAPEDIRRHANSSTQGFYEDLQTLSFAVENRNILAKLQNALATNGVANALLTGLKKKQQEQVIKWIDYVSLDARNKILCATHTIYGLIQTGYQAELQK